MTRDFLLLASKPTSASNNGKKNDGRTKVIKTEKVDDKNDQKRKV